MTKDDIIKMAAECDYFGYSAIDPRLHKFAALVAEHVHKQVTKELHPFVRSQS